MNHSPDVSLAARFIADAFGNFSLGDGHQQSPEIGPIIELISPLADAQKQAVKGTRRCVVVVIGTVDMGWNALSHDLLQPFAEMLVQRLSCLVVAGLELT